MVLETRRGVTVLVMVLLAAGVAVLRLRPQQPADPCVVRPATHACAVFAAPDWLTRRVHAGRAGGPSWPQASRSQPVVVVDERPLLAIVGETSQESDLRGQSPGGV